MRRIIFIFLLAGLWINGAAEAKIKALSWSTDVKPGDKVCIYDISEDDPLVDDHNDSLKYWYRMPSGDQVSKRQLRPLVRKLHLRVLWPGLKISQPDKLGQYWYSGSLVIVKGGYRPTEAKMYTIQRGKNTLLGQKGRSWVLPWQVLHFEAVRLTKKQTLQSCARKYESF